MKVLVADDHPGVLSRVQGIICDAFPAANVSYAENGAKVLEHCNSSRYDILIMDIRMPGFSGFDVLRELRKKHSLPVILISTYSGEQYSIAAVKAGANAFISKDALYDQLVNTLFKLLEEDAV